MLIADAGCCCWWLLLIAFAGCCCWWLLLIALAGCCCWWLLLIALAGCCCWWLLLVAFAGCCCWWLLLVAFAGCCCWWWLLIAFAGCWLPESLRIFPEYWWFAAKTILQAKKSLNLFGCWWKVFEYFRVVGEKSLNISWFLMEGRWKRVSPPGSKVVDGRQCIMKNGCAPGIYTQFFKMAGNFGESQ